MPFANFQDFITRLIKAHSNDDEDSVDVAETITSDGFTTEHTLEGNSENVVKKFNDTYDNFTNKGLTLIKSSVKQTHSIKLGDQTKHISEYVITQFDRDLTRNREFSPPKMTQDGSTREYLLLIDFHAPYHNKKLIDGAVDFGIANNFYGCIIGGDVLDLAYFGNYTKKLAFFSKQQTKDAIDEMGELFDYIGKSFPYKAFIEGNHDERISRNALGNGISGEGLKAYKSLQDIFSVSSLLNINRFSGEEEWRNFNALLRYKESIFIGKGINGIKVHHGEEHSKNINPDRIKYNNIYGHTHRMETKLGATVDENNNLVTVAEYRTGCLLNLSEDIPAMGSKVKEAWNNGFAILTEHMNGDVFVNNILIRNGKFVYNSKVVDLYGT